jgi:hypothetical protein
MDTFRLRWQRLDPWLKALLIGLVLGAVIAVLTRQPFWIAALAGGGAVVGWLIQSARARREEPRPSERRERPDPLRFRTRYQDDEDEDHQPGEVSPRTGGRQAVAPPPSAGGVGDPDHEVVARARGEKLLNAAFTLTLFNHRHTGPGRPGQEPIDARAALGDLHDAESIDDAVLRAEELLAHAQDLGYGPRDASEDRAELQLSHPGFSPEHLSEALRWGYSTGR